MLRHGFRFFGRTFRVAYFAPAHGLNPDALARFERNELAVTRQTPCHPGKGDTLDLVFGLNGVPAATCELKNPMTGQTWRDAVRQYQQDRDPNAPLFRFKRRALVHFAADSDEVHMATRLAGDATRFLPFNRGSNPGAVHCGAGNPPNPDGYCTDYFWHEVLQRERFLDILGSYVLKRWRCTLWAAGCRLGTRSRGLRRVRRSFRTAGEERSVSMRARARAGARAVRRSSCSLGPGSLGLPGGLRTARRRSARCGGVGGSIATQRAACGHCRQDARGRGGRLRRPSRSVPRSAGRPIAGRRSQGRRRSRTISAR